MTSKASSPRQDRRPSEQRVEGNLGQKEAQQQQKSETELRQMEQSSEKPSGTSQGQ